MKQVVRKQTTNKGTAHVRAINVSARDCLFFHTHSVSAGYAAKGIVNINGEKENG